MCYVGRGTTLATLRYVRKTQNLCDVIKNVPKKFTILICIESKEDDEKDVEKRQKREAAADSTSCSLDIDCVGLK